MQLQKLKKSSDALTLTLQPTVDILATVAALMIPPYCVGFAAESQDVERLGEEKRLRKKLPLLIANRAQDALGSDFNEVTLLDDTGAQRCRARTSRRWRGNWWRRLPGGCPTAASSCRIFPTPPQGPRPSACAKKATPILKPADTTKPMRCLREPARSPQSMRLCTTD